MTPKESPRDQAELCGRVVPLHGVRDGTTPSGTVQLTSAHSPRSGQVGRDQLITKTWIPQDVSDNLRARRKPT